jgi:hypothetical protein
MIIDRESTAFSLPDVMQVNSRVEEKPMSMKIEGFCPRFFLYSKHACLLEILFCRAVHVIHEQKDLKCYSRKDRRRVRFCLSIFEAELLRSVHENIPSAVSIETL